MKRGKAKSSKSGFIQLWFLLGVLSLLGIYILIEDGYGLFVNMGWNVGLIIFLRKASYLFAIAFFTIISYLLIKFYSGVVKDWHSSSSFSDLPKFVEKGIVSFFLVGPCILMFAFIIGIIYILFTVDESHWHGPWELLDR